MNEQIYKRQWDVASFTHPNKNPYKVSERLDGNWECSCPHWIHRHPEGGCKHILKIQNAIRYLPTAPAWEVTIEKQGTAIWRTVEIEQETKDTALVFEGYTIRRRILEVADETINVPARTLRRKL